ncbi:MAG: hypothetical protein LBK02_06050 [Treponema sp.]|nr:hypothetical protein [Treponema sp.]
MRKFILGIMLVITMSVNCVLTSGCSNPGGGIDDNLTPPEEIPSLTIGVWGRYLTTATALTLIYDFKTYCTTNSINYDKITYRYYADAVYHTVANFGAKILKDGDVDIVLPAGANIGESGGGNIGILADAVAPPRKKSLSTVADAGDGSGSRYIGRITDNELAAIFYDDFIELDRAKNILSTAGALQPQKHALFIGNSFTYYNNLEQIFESIASDAGIAINAVRVAIGSSTLENFADPTHANGQALTPVLEGQNNFDYVILQENSTRPINYPNRFLSAARALQNKINATQTHAEIYLYETWGYPDRAGESRYGGTVPAMEGLLRAAYADVGETLDIPVCWVGKAFTKVFEDHGEINLYQTDQTHPSYAGSYLSACVHAMTVLGIDPRTLTFCGSLSEANAAILRQAAYDAATPPE